MSAHILRKKNLKIKDVPGWPPKVAQCAEQHALFFEPEQAAGLLIDSVTYIPGSGKPGGNGRPGDILLKLEDQAKAIECTARLKVPDPEMARKILDALARCVGLTLLQAGLRKMANGTARL